MTFMVEFHRSGLQRLTIHMKRYANQPTWHSRGIEAESGTELGGTSLRNEGRGVTILHALRSSRTCHPERMHVYRSPPTLFRVLWLAWAA